MKKFLFTLGRLRNYRDRLLDEEKNKLGQLRQKQIEIEQRIEMLKQSFLDISKELLEEQRKGLPAYKLRSFDLKLTSVRELLKQLEIDLKKATLDVDEQMDVVVEAQREVTKLDKLEEKQREAYDADVRKAEADRIEELVSSNAIRKSIS